MESKLSELKANYKLWLTLDNGEGVLGDGKWLLLATIHELGSITKAVEKLGVSYRKAWGDLRKMEQMLSISVIEKQRGGADGGRTKLTPQGIFIIQAYKKFHDDFESLAQKAFDKFKIELSSPPL
jgi:molybdate transport system regulatory protein